VDKQVQQKPARFLLVDFENIQKIDLSRLDGRIQIIVFVGANQTKLSTDLVIKHQKLGSRLEWRQVDGNGKNAVDFVIAYYMGKVFDKDARAECIVLSHDKGFDPLIKMLKKEGKNCRRIETTATLE